MLDTSCSSFYVFYRFNAPLQILLQFSGVSPCCSVKLHKQEVTCNL